MKASQVSMSCSVNPERQCPREDCGGWEGHVTYVTGQTRTRLPVRENCVALDVWLKSEGERLEPCPLHDEPTEYALPPVHIALLREARDLLVHRDDHKIGVGPRCPGCRLEQQIDNYLAEHIDGPPDG